MGFVRSNCGVLAPYLPPAKTLSTPHFAPPSTRPYGSTLLQASEVHQHLTRFSASSSVHQLSTSRHFGQRSLHRNLILEWNGLPNDLRNIEKFCAFKKKLKVHVAQQAYEAE
eukprot:Pompholyxophrys_punicea_v1_NODE_1135_length_920_cov_5.352601.p2 type:complete len:112 gc:universal NODE_1135_length_920_cov_5.352601:551-886(+)